MFVKQLNKNKNKNNGLRRAMTIRCYNRKD